MNESPRSSVCHFQHNLWDHTNFSKIDSTPKWMRRFFSYPCYIIKWTRRNRWTATMHWLSRIDGFWLAFLVKCKIRIEQLKDAPSLFSSADSINRMQKKRKAEKRASFHGFCIQIKWFALRSHRLWYTQQECLNYSYWWRTRDNCVCAPRMSFVWIFHIISFANEFD